MAKYDTLQKYFQTIPEGINTISLNYDQIDAIVELPPSAWGSDRTWWGNTYGKPQGRAWLRAGWKVDDIFNSFVTFKRKVKSQ